ncbi:MAG: DinB family protein [Thermoplasmata archaeon]
MKPLTMLRFNRRVRKALIERLAELPEEFEKNAEISFYSIRDTLFHVIRTEDFWVNGFLTDQGRLVRRKEKEELESALDLERLWDGVSDRTEAFIQSLTTADLQQVRERQLGDTTVRKTVEEYLFTFMIHEVYHKGEVLAVLWQGDNEPPPVDYWRY